MASPPVAASNDIEAPAIVESELQPGNGHAPESDADGRQPPEESDKKLTSDEEVKLLLKLRKYLALLAVLAAAITYRAGLAPPGGFWQDNKNNRLASEVVLKVSYPKRYKVFFYCNTTAFVASLIILILLLIRKLGHHLVWLRSLQIAMLLDLLGLMGAYAAGSSRELRTSVYIWVLLLGIFAYVTLHVVFFRHLAPDWLRHSLMGVRKCWKDTIEKYFKENEETETSPDDKKQQLGRNRNLLLVLATLAAAVTYTAGLGPPGGFWPDDKKGIHLAGDPVLRDRYPRRFKAFLVCNATAFAGSLVIIIMLLSNTAVDHVVKSNALRLCVLVSLFGLMGAYAAGSNRKVHTSLYVFALVGAVLLYLVIQWVWPILPKPKYVQEFVVSMNEKKGKLLKKLKSFLTSSTVDSNDKLRNVNDLEKLRTYLLLLGSFAATVTYQAGLNPPGGFWPDSVDGHLAGDPILQTINPKRYKVFFYCNATAFAASLVIITLLQSQLITIGALKRHVLQTAMILDLFGVMGAYAAGTSRKISTSLYVSVLVLVVFTYVMLHVLLFVALKTRLKKPIEKMGYFLKRICGRTDDGSDQWTNEDLEKRRKFLMLLAILAASITYQAGISTPGGFWTDNNDGHRAGHPVFHDEFPRRYRLFFYFNATAFMASLAVIMLLVSKRLCRKGLKCYALRTCVLVDLISVMGAFAVGTCRKVSSSIYVILVVISVFVYVVIQVLVFTFAKNKVNGLRTWMLVKMFFGSTYQSINHNTAGKDRKRTEHKWRKDLMLIGTLAVTVTYQAGLLPPGGLWPDDRDGHYAGDPVLHDTYPKRYKVFFYCNATSFMASVVMVLLLLNNTISKYERSLLPMKTAMVLDLLGLLGAYASGSCRKLKTSVYVFALVAAVFIYFVVHVVLSFDKAAKCVKEKVEYWMPCLKNLWEEIEPPKEQTAEQPSEAYLAVNTS